MGSGKSHGTALLPLEKAIYYDINHRNVSTSSVAENFVDLFPRSHRYPEQKFIINFIGTHLDLDWLREYGIRVLNCSAFEICPDAIATSNPDMARDSSGGYPVLRCGDEARSLLLSWTLCGEHLFNGEELHTHHKIRVVDGGTNREDNLIHLHKTCHHHLHMGQHSVV